MNIIAISGGLRAGSTNTMLINAFKAVAPAGTNVEICSFADFPIYTQDAEVNFPPQVQALKDKIVAADGIIIATPEFNRGVPGGLKNAIDWVSRPYGKNAFAGKAVLVAGVSVGKVGTALAQYQLKQSLLHLDAKVVGQPEIMIGPSAEYFDASGLTDASTKELLVKGLAALAARV